ncbi:MAG: isopentenyl phosphate kinase, partial [Chloroflexota bacterium]
WASRPGLRLVIGHGSGSFGHVAAARYGTRRGVYTSEQWRGLVEVAATAARLNRLVLEALLAAGVPAVSFQPSASAVCQAGRLHYLAVEPIQAALAAGLVPLVYGDVAFDTQQGGTIISTEEVMSYLAEPLRPSWMLLAGETAGVLDADGRVVSHLTPQNFARMEDALGGSRGTDVTGGMAGKVRQMLALIAARPHLSIRIFSGLVEGAVESFLRQPEKGAGTVMTAG